MDVRSHHVAQRLEQRQHADRGEDCVQVHRLKSADELGEDVPDARQSERDRGRYHRASEHLVQIEEALAGQRLRQDVQEHDAEHRPDGR